MHHDQRPRSPTPTSTAAAAGVAVALAASVGVACASGAAAKAGDTANVSADVSTDVSADVADVTALLHRYEAALNGSAVDDVVALYAPDGVFMAQHRSPAVGLSAVQAAYQDIFGMIRLDIRFEIDEVVVVTPSVAYARTRSAGTTTILDNGAKVSEGNQELFILRKGSDQAWKISRYIFSTTQARG